MTARSRLSYLAIATLLGLALGWVPYFLHGPIPEKFNPHFIRGDVAVWAYYFSRMAIGFFIGVAIWPRRWWLRGPLFGAVLMLPPGLISLAVPECGST